MNITMKQTIKSLLGVTFLLGSTAASTASAATIDLFTEAQAVTDTTKDGNAVSSSTATGLASIIGGQRDISVNVDPSSPGAFPNTTMQIGFGVLSFTNGSGSTGGGLVQWDGADQTIALNATGLGGVDLTADGSNAFLYNVFDSDFGFEFEIRAYTSALDYAILTINNALAVDNAWASHVPVALFFSYFSGPDYTGTIVPGLGTRSLKNFGSGVDLTNLGALEIYLNTGTYQDRVSELDLSIGSVTTTVPEPATLSLLGLGLLAAGMSRRQKQA